jgi:hypothetical protein
MLKLATAGLKPRNPALWGPRQLWSLWGIMNKVNAEAIFRGTSIFSKLFQKWSMELAGRQPFDAGQMAFFLDTANEMSEALQGAELRIARRHADDLIAEMNQATAQPDGSLVLEGIILQRAYHHLDRLLAVIAEEAGTRLFISVGADAVELYEPSKPRFGKNVAEKFSSIAYEIEEAGKCLALERSTAAAFHSIRSLEAGIAALSRCLQIPDPAKTMHLDQKYTQEGEAHF